MKKFFISLLFFFLFIFNSIVRADEIDKIISESNFELTSTVSLFVQNQNNDDIVYKKNENKLLNPASILKLISFGTAYSVLKEGYKFETAVYKDKNNNLYVKLGGDTLLTQSDLNNLFSKVKTKLASTKIKNIYIDDSIFDKTPYPQGWMEDDLWPYSRAITPYIVDKNFTPIALSRSSLATKVDIIQNNPYKLAVINELKPGDVHDIEISRLGFENSPIVIFRGTVSKDEILNVPVLNPEINFNIKLRLALEKNGILYSNNITPLKTPKDAIKLDFVYHSIEDISKDILYNSDNFSSEVVFRVGAYNYLNCNQTATLNDAVNMVNEKFPFDEGIVMVDGSGVSRYNLVSTRYIVNVIKELLKDEKFKNLLETPKFGTLKYRLPYLENNLRAKTGTLSRMSSLAGILTTQKGNEFVFCLITQNSPKRAAILKNFEDNIITALYRKY